MENAERNNASSTIDYDYDAYAKKPAQQTGILSESEGRRTQKPKKAKSERPTLLQLLSELVGGSNGESALKRTRGGGTGKNGGKREDEKRTPSLSAGDSKAFGANALQLFDKRSGSSGQSQPLSISFPNAAATFKNSQRPFLLDVDLPSRHSTHSSSHEDSTAPNKNNAASIRAHTTQKITQERLRINEGCKSWSDFQRLMDPRLNRPKLVAGRVQKVCVCCKSEKKNLKEEKFSKFGQ